MENNKPSLLEMLTALANNHSLIKEMNINGLKLSRRIAWIKNIFPEEEITTQYGYIQNGSGKL